MLSTVYGKVVQVYFHVKPQFLGTEGMESIWKRILSRLSKLNIRKLCRVFIVSVVPLQRFCQIYCGWRKMETSTEDIWLSILNKDIERFQRFCVKSNSIKLARIVSEAAISSQVIDIKASRWILSICFVHLLLFYTSCFVVRICLWNQHWRQFLRLFFVWNWITFAELMNKRLDFLMLLIKQLPLPCIAMLVPFGRSKGS